MQNALKCNEWRRNFVHKAFKIEIQKGGLNNSDFFQNCFPAEIRSPNPPPPPPPLSPRNLQIFQDFKKITPESCRMDWNLMNYGKFWRRKLLKLNYRRGDQIIQTFFKIFSPQKLGPLSLICRNVKALRKVLLNHAECIEI